MLHITMVQKTYNKKQGFKNAYALIETETSEINEQTHKNITSEETCKWFRRLGGSETVQREYTCIGYKVTKLISTSPNKEIKRVREFTFKWIEPTKQAN